MSDQIKVMFIKPCWEPQIIKIGNNLTAFQDLVMGYIETVTLDDTFVAVVNEEGRLRNLEENIQTEKSGILVGNVVICRTDGEEFASLEEGDEEEIMNLIELI